jgi:hypothetical protein
VRLPILDLAAALFGPAIGIAYYLLWKAAYPSQRQTPWWVVAGLLSSILAVSMTLVAVEHVIKCACK